jgi:UDP-N-acetyl-D-mannosaminuronate dehydrogenase
MKDKTVCIVGLGYAGLPLAKAFMTGNKSVEYELICILKKK